MKMFYKFIRNAVHLAPTGVLTDLSQVERSHLPLIGGGIDEIAVPCSLVAPIRFRSGCGLRGV